ncbi:MAG: AI-2E family transporter [Actinomycetota bacterium]|nr:AI-2E family transporter [Actinomycetota bacterium]
MTPSDRSPGDDAEQGPLVLRLRFGFGTTLTVVAAVAAGVALVAVIGASRRIIGWAVACAILALILHWVTARLRRVLPLGLAVAAAVVILATFVSGTLVGALATIDDNVEALSEDAPAAARRIEQRSETATSFRLAERVEAFVEDLEPSLGGAEGVQRAAGTASAYLVSGVLLIFFLVYGPSFVRSGLRQIDDPDRRSRVTRTILDTLRRAQGYLVAAVAQAVAVTLALWALFWALELPAPFVLALASASLGVIPFIGIVIGGLPAVLFAAATEDAGPIVAVAVALVGLQLVEALLIRPRVDARTVRVGPALAAISALVGFELYGIGGAVYGAALAVVAAAAADAGGVLVVDSARRAGELPGDAGEQGGVVGRDAGPRPDEDA